MPGGTGSDSRGQKLTPAEQGRRRRVFRVVIALTLAVNAAYVIRDVRPLMLVWQWAMICVMYIAAIVTLYRWASHYVCQKCGSQSTSIVRRFESDPYDYDGPDAYDGIHCNTCGHEKKVERISREVASPAT